MFVKLLVRKNVLTGLLALGGVTPKIGGVAYFFSPLTNMLVRKCSIYFFKPLLTDLPTQKSKRNQFFQILFYLDLISTIPPKIIPKLPDM